MQYKCEVCHDSGSTNYSGEYLNCPDCDLPIVRRDLNAFVKSLGPTHPEDVALAIHQRALAMAPKQEAIKVADERAAFDAWYDVTPSRQAHAWDAWKHRASIAAPAAANGALTDERAAFEADTLDLYPSAKFNRFPSGTYTDSFIETQWGAWQRRSKFAAAGPDAAPNVEALRDILLGVIPAKMAEKHGRDFFQGEGQDEHRAEVKGFNACRDEVYDKANKAFQAALSGAKGN